MRPEYRLALISRRTRGQDYEVANGVRFLAPHESCQLTGSELVFGGEIKAQ